MKICELAVHCRSHLVPEMPGRARKDTRGNASHGTRVLLAAALLCSANGIVSCSGRKSGSPESGARASMGTSGSGHSEAAAIDALIKQNTAAFSQLCAHSPCDQGDSRYANSTPLQMASIIGNQAAVEMLLNNGSDPRAKNSDGRDALMMAAEGGRAEVVRVLLRRGADISAKDEKGATALLLASIRNHPEVVAELLRAGADMTVTDDLGQTPLHVAVAKGRIRVVRLLVEQGADVNAEDEEGWTPLRLAKRYGYPGIEQLLLRAGAEDLDAVDPEDDSLDGF